MSAISLSAFQKASSMITLTLRPLILTYLLTFADLPNARVDGEILSGRKASGGARLPTIDPKDIGPLFSPCASLDAAERLALLYHP